MGKCAELQCSRVHVANIVRAATAGEESLSNGFPTIATNEAQAPDGSRSRRKQTLITLLDMLNEFQNESDLGNGGAGERSTLARLCCCPPYPLYRVSSEATVRR